MNEDVINIGDEVLCIDSSIKPEALLELAQDVPNWVKQGSKYIVRDVMYNNDIATGILLEEVVNKPIYFHLLGRVQEPAFAKWRFVKQQTAYQIAEKEEEVEEIEIEDINGVKYKIKWQSKNYK